MEIIRNFIFDYNNAVSENNTLRQGNLRGKNHEGYTQKTPT